MAGESTPRTRRSWARAIGAVVVRPTLWPTAARQWARMTRGWWRRPPFLPRPDREYLRFRLETQYGEHGSPAPHDLVRYLEWCRAEHRRNRRGRQGGPRQERPR